MNEIELMKLKLIFPSFFPESFNEIINHINDNLYYYTKEDEKTSKEIYLYLNEKDIFDKLDEQYPEAKLKPIHLQAFKEDLMEFAKNEEDEDLIFLLQKDQEQKTLNSNEELEYKEKRINYELKQNGFNYNINTMIYFYLNLNSWLFGKAIDEFETTCRKAFYEYIENIISKNKNLNYF